MNFEFLDDSDADLSDLPPYSRKGRILFRLHSIDCHKAIYKYDLDVLDYDNDTSVYWISEGIGFEYLIDELVELDNPGVYVLEGVHGEYIRGDWSWGEDDDEEWYFDICRYATEEEIETECLG